MRPTFFGVVAALALAAAVATPAAADWHGYGWDGRDREWHHGWDHRDWHRDRDWYRDERPFVRPLRCAPTLPGIPQTCWR